MAGAETAPLGLRKALLSRISIVERATTVALHSAGPKQGTSECPSSELVRWPEPLRLSFAGLILKSGGFDKLSPSLGRLGKQGKAADGR